jgi:hypothetical protein
VNRDQARALVRSTFTHAFDKVKFRNFAINLLNEYDEAKSFFYNSTYIKDAFKEHVSRFERLGTYTSPKDEKLDVLIVHLTNESKLERARTAIRNFVADHLKQRDNKEAALVAFVSPTEQQWRFSYVKMEYTTVQKETGKIGVESRLTPARRFSYIVGEGESCHTAQTRFLDLLQDTENNPTLANIEDAFSVEAVTKEFFTQYRQLFEDINAALEKLAVKNKTIRDEFEKKNVNTVDFAKKLMGQIVFLYFLQKKGWLGVEKSKDWGSGPNDFLRRLASSKYGSYENFFNDILEPLFYDTLATDRGHEAWCKTFTCRIPFLNGGLFEPLCDYNWKKTDIILPNKLFTNSEFVEEGIAGTGVLDVFDRYNFTVNEAEPLEKEVAIDPEMLGKVFENLIEENRRKGLGSYYTPREIVHYMCQESLINYLDSALNTVKEPIALAKPVQTKLLGEADPEQVGLKTTGRREIVPRSDIETFVHLGDQISHYEAVEARYSIKMPKTVIEHARLIDEKLAEITVCDPAVGSGAFPVGMMTEIVRARSALTPYFNDPHDRTPYHFKRHAIQNCLYGVDIDPGAVEIAKLRLWLSLVVDEEDVKQIKPLPNLDFKIVTGNSLIGFPFKSQRLQKIEQLKARFFEETEHDRKAELKRQIDQELSECFAASKKSLGYNVNFDFEINFSEVLYGKGGFDVVIANPPYVDSEEMTRKHLALRQLYGSLYATAKGNWDLFIIFIEKGLLLMQPCGTISYIVPNKLIGAPYSEALREMLQHHTICSIRDYSAVRVFLEADVYPVVFTIQKGNQKRTVVMATMSALETVSCSNSVTPSVFYGDILWGRYFQPPATLAILMKCAQFPRLDNLLPKISGAATVSEAYALKDFIREFSGKEKKPFKKLVNTGTIDPFCSLWSVQPTRYIKAAYTAPIVFDADLGALNQTRLEQARSRKIIIGGMTRRLECFYDEGEYLAGKSTVIILPSGKGSLKYVTALLNSSLISFWYRGFYNALCLAGGYLRINGNEIRTIPIPAASPGKQKRVEEVVDRILAMKTRDAGADTSAWEREIDQCVYDLYSLTAEEIQIVENSTK